MDSFLNFLNKSLKIKWLITKFKVFRNQLFLDIYLTKKPDDYNLFINSVRFLKGSNVAIIVAFEQPWALDWLLKMGKKNLKHTTLLVFDNSRDLNIRSKIKSVCQKNKTPYFSLPQYKTNHVNRSHGMAMSWIYKHIVKVIQPKVFAFIDHDLIPFRPINLAKLVKTQPFYGRETGKKKIGYWSLWAGYCIFNFNHLKDKKINFLYDFSRGLDTGGRNWKPLYAHFQKETLAFAPLIRKTIFLPAFKKGFNVEFVDEKWIHIAGISYNNNFEQKFKFFKALAKEIDINSQWYQSIKMKFL